MSFIKLRKEFFQAVPAHSMGNEQKMHTVHL